MKRLVPGLAVAAIGLILAAAALGSFTPGGYSGHTSQRCPAGAGGICKPGSALPISFRVRTSHGRTMITDLRWTETTTCTVPPPHNHTTGGQGPISVKVTKAGRFSYYSNSEQVITRIQGRLSGKRASGTLSDSLTTQPGDTCKTGSVGWSARTK